MDYLVELARHPELLSAIKLPQPAVPAGPARDLLRLEFLCKEHPSTWIAEAVHVLYEHPDFARQVWVNLRYCPAFKRQLADRVLRERAGFWAWSAPSDADIGALAESFDVDAVNAHCSRLGLYPDAPTFLADLLKAEEVKDPTITDPKIRDARTAEYLEDPDSVRDLSREHAIPIPFGMVLEKELDQIDETRGAVHRSQGPHLPLPGNLRRVHATRRALDQNLMGLAFSGGGIRSATFNLGVLQALAKIGLLKHFDYLSTVSGGGYIGSWFAAWAHRESMAHATPAAAMSEMQRRLSPQRNPNPLDERVKPIRFLREYSNYLTPRTGFFSADTWTMLGIYLRNTVLNQVIIVSLFAAVLLIPRNWYAAIVWLQTDWWVPWPPLLWILGVVLLVLNLRRLDPHSSEASVKTASGMTPRATEARPPAYAKPWVIHWFVVLPWLLAAAIAAVKLGPWAIVDRIEVAGAPVPSAALWFGALIAGTLLAALSVGGSYRCWSGQHSPWAKLESTLTILGSALLAGVVGVALTWALVGVLAFLAPQGGVELRWHLTVLGGSGLMSVLSLAIVVQLGMLGEKFPDEHREWWSRLRTFIHVYAIGWLAWFALAIYVPWVVHVLGQHRFGWTSALTALATWVASTIFGVQRGQSAEEDGKQPNAAPGRSGGASAALLRWATLAAPFVFIAGLVVAISLAIDGIFRAVAPGDPNYWAHAEWTTQGWKWLWTVAFVIVGFLFSWRVDINEFSIHHFYKNRLVRCYLGASRSGERKADWFTGFDPNDDMRLAAFDNEKRQPGACYPGPYPIINCALNLVGGQDLAWQERKATSFVFTPKYCGYDLDRAVLTKNAREHQSEAYVPTTQYYRRDEGPLLGMAMAISGAAANPNMGRATSPASAFLMTVFNVRLGWWIGNPRRRKAAAAPGPTFGLTYTALELFGGTDDGRAFVNLSDGGHFDNLGVYELIRRGCRFIVVCDAGHDPDTVCEDLGNLVRRCRTDFGVEIDIAIDRIAQHTTTGASHAHCVVGEIHYLHVPRRDDRGRAIAADGGPLLRGTTPAHEVGYLVYLKPSITGDEPQDVIEYRRRIPQFPHESTADQWFDESQFESYRKLGMHVAEQTFARYQADDSHSVGSIPELFEKLHQFWYPPVTSVVERSSAHAEEYSRIMEMVRTQPTLRALDQALFDGLKSDGKVVPADPRDEFYVCNALLQLIENVYADLNLERHWQHPSIQGWMQVFERWARQPAFRRTWKIAECTYAQAFRNFYNDRLRGRPLGLRTSFIAAQPGAHGNTVAAIERAIAAGAGVIAMDVTRVGGELVLSADTSTHGLSSPLTVASVSGVVSGTSLVRCLADLQGRVQLSLGLPTPGLEKDVVEALRTSGWDAHDFALTSNNRDILKEVRKVCADARLGLIVNERSLFKTYFNEFLDLEADFLAPEESLVTLEDLHKAERGGVVLVPWIVGTEDRLRMFFNHTSVAGIVTENVDLAWKVKEEM
jgi:hypothetical protein